MKSEPFLGELGPIFGRYGGILNRWGWLRCGWGWNDNLGRVVFRVSIGGPGKRLPFTGEKF